jgi:hypothetical protein
LGVYTGAEDIFWISSLTKENGHEI